MICRLNRKKNEIHKLHLQLISAKSETDHLRAWVRKHQRTEPSVLDQLPRRLGLTGRLSSQKEELQEQLRMQQKEVYSLQQELYHVSRAYHVLQEKVALRVCVEG